MPFKDPEVRKIKAREYAARYYRKNQARVQSRTARNKARYRDEWREYKASFSCAGCGLTGFPDVLDFHHLPEYRDDESKRSVNRLLAYHQYTRAREETEKCVALCANCHRLGHHMERQGWPEVLEGLLAKLRPYFLSGEAYMALVYSSGSGAAIEKRRRGAKS